MSKEEKSKVSTITDEDRKMYYSFLDTLRETGVTNMFGATPYLVDVYNLDEKTARIILGDWMKQFGARKDS